jgi:hypothetical protein
MGSRIQQVAARATKPAKRHWRFQRKNGRNNPGETFNAIASLNHTAPNLSRPCHAQYIPAVRIASKIR